jgi:hypothetical protein
MNAGRAARMRGRMSSTRNSAVEGVGLDNEYRREDSPVQFNHVERRFSHSRIDTGAEVLPLPRRISKKYTTEETKQFVDELDHRLEAIKRSENFWKSGYLDPDTSRMRSFDAIVAVCLVFTTLVTPYEVALLQTVFNTRFVVNCCIDLVYFFDMVRSFFTAFHDKQTNTLITSGPRIRRHYMQSWFLIDFVSVLPFDVLSLTAGEDFQKLKAIKIIRLLRLLKLAKIFRSLEFYDRYKSKVAIPLNVVSLFQNCLKMLICSHWMACAWILTATLQCDEVCMKEEYGTLPATTWLRTVEMSDDYRFGTYNQYLSGVYWAIATITSVGYGDVTATNSVERLVACVSLLVSGLLWASIIGDICGIIATLDVNGIEFRQTYDQINTMMLDLKAPYQTCVDVRTFCFKTEQLNKLNKYRVLLKQLSPNLRGRVAANLLMPIMNGMQDSNLRYQHERLHGDVKRNVTARLAMRVEHEAYAPDEQFGHPRCLYCLLTGVTLRMGVVNLSGALWGSDLMIRHEFLRSPHHCVAITHLIVQKLKLSDLKEGFAGNPTEWAVLKCQSAKLAMCRAIVRAAFEAESNPVLNRLAGGLHLEHTFHESKEGTSSDREHGVLGMVSQIGDSVAMGTEAKHVQQMAMAEMGTTLASVETSCMEMKQQMDQLGRNQMLLTEQLGHMKRLFEAHGGDHSIA